MGKFSFIKRGAAKRRSEQISASRNRIVATSMAKRRRLERQLDQGVCQELIVLNLKLGLLRARFAGDEDFAAVLDELNEQLLSIGGQLRAFGHDLYPSILERSGLPDALSQALQASQVPTELDCLGVGRYPLEIEAAVYFCCLEAVENAVRHAGRHAKAQVWIHAAGGQLTFSVADDGLGFAADPAHGRGGLEHMADLLAAIGGDLEVASAPGTGTTIRGRIPVGKLGWGGPAHPAVAAIAASPAL